MKQRFSFPIDDKGYFQLKEVLVRLAFDLLENVFIYRNHGEHGNFEHIGTIVDLTSSGFLLEDEENRLGEYLQRVYEVHYRGDNREASVRIFLNEPILRDEAQLILELDSMISQEDVLFEVGVLFLVGRPHVIPEPAPLAVEITEASAALPQISSEIVFSFMAGILFTMMPPSED